MPQTFTLTGLSLLDGGQEQTQASVTVAGGRFQRAVAAGRVVEAPGWYAAPGFIDLQLNGAYGHDFTGDPGSIPAVARRLPESGVTAFLPTFITSPLESYPEKLAAVQQAQEAAARDLAGGGASPPGARILGAHLEGPFLNPESRGAHPAELFAPPTQENLAHYTPLEAVRLVTLAVELPGGLQAAAWLQERGVTVSLGHTRASAEQAGQAFAGGVRLVTHLFNAMPPLHHRQPGVIGAVLAGGQGVRAGLIADGIHAHPLVLRLAYQALGSGGVVLVSDAMAAMGMPPGQYRIGGQEVSVQDGRAALADGTLAGSILQMDQAVRYLVQEGICSPAEAVRMASLTPAEALGLQGELGRLLPGWPADLVLLDAGLRVQATFVGGRLAFAAPQARPVLAALLEENPL
jgi:N-acetylglucosamine-6-phosphate deacetylase